MPNPLTHCARAGDGTCMFIVSWAAATRFLTYCATAGTPEILFFKMKEWWVHWIIATNFSLCMKNTKCSERHRVAFLREFTCGLRGPWPSLVKYPQVALCSQFSRSCLFSLHHKDQRLICCTLWSACYFKLMHSVRTCKKHIKTIWLYFWHFHTFLHKYLEDTFQLSPVVCHS